jgi:hypothetical protein
MYVEWVGEALKFQFVLVPGEELIQPFRENLNTSFWWGLSRHGIGTTNPNARRS